MRKKEKYFVEKEGDTWVVRVRTLGIPTTLCSTDLKGNAEQIAVALNIFELAEKAVGELPGAKNFPSRDLSYAGRRELVEKFEQVKTDRRKVSQALERRACSSAFVQIVAALLLALLVLALLVTLIQRFLL